MIRVSKEIVRALLRKAGFELKRVSSKKLDPEEDYLKGGRIPWSYGYQKARQKYICEVLADSDLLEVFQKGDKLPKQFGLGFDERCVEYPWLLSRLKPGPECVLDAGSSLNHEFILERSVFKDKKLHILTLSPGRNCLWRKGISYLFHDLREIPILDQYYDTIACVSTLEHVGMDNRSFTKSETHDERRPEDFIVALLEMRRVLKPGGRIFITVPYGSYGNYETFQQFDVNRLNHMINVFEPDQKEQVFYRYTVNGWNISTEEKCSDVAYSKWTMQIPDQRPAMLSDHPDRAAAARAIACLKLVKPR